MKAVLWKGPDDLVVDDVPDPESLPGECVLRVADCGICGSELHASKYGLLPPDAIMGHEFAGTIVDVGAGVSGWRVGDRVASLPYHACGTCERCLKGEGLFCAAVKGMGYGELPGAYAEYTRVSPHSLIRLPDSVSNRRGALAEPLSVGLHVARNGNIRPGAGVIVMGGGPVGLATAIWAKREGAECVVVSDLSEWRRGMARRLGADAVAEAGKEDPRDILMERTGREPDVVFDCVGVPGTINAAMQMAGLRGRIVVAGVCLEADSFMPLIGIMKESEIKFVLAYLKQEFQQTVDALADGTLQADAMITDVIDIASVPATFRTLATPTTQSKVLIEM
jgi:(R,R)-butanediol dehydrogenase/meso-butanediol dehydrogenase/diacetyl reductase